MFKIKKSQNDFETTEMTPEFEQERRNFNDYRDAIAAVKTALEGIIQPNPAIVAAAKGSDDIAYPDDRPSPLEDLHARLQTYKSQVNNINMTMVEKTVARASRLVRDNQRRMSANLTPLRTFPNNEFVRFEKTMRAFDEARNRMDMSKHEVKQSKTTLEIEKKAVAYQKDVESFDGFCTSAIKILEELPGIQISHGKAITAALRHHREYHHQMAEAWK